ncbi:MAG: 4-hydroxy-tetrahydrodipicolinate reductase [Betaproteobacteria bacterium]|nr:4-hydroxy-tetrahydrodipicolinate reductase [Betaproteobacteria bacterium]
MKVAIAGASGRMGRTLIEAVLRSPDLDLSAALDVIASGCIGKDAGELVGIPCGVKVATDAALAAASDCLIDFSRPEGTLAHLEACAAAGIPMVIGTTGFNAEQRSLISDAARRIAIVFAPNMAIGVNAAFKLAEVAARILGDAYDVEIIEAHHRHKVDAPSGTALKLGEVVAQALGRELKDCAVYGRAGLTGERDARTIAIHAIRGGDIVGDHTVMFAGAGERVEITVRSQSRLTYALGALRACRYLKDRPAGLYDMHDVLGLR